MLTRYVVYAPILAEVRAGLMEAARHSRFQALSIQLFYPLEVERPAIFARLAADGDSLDFRRVEMRRKVDRPDHRGYYDETVPYRHTEEYRHSVVGTILIFYRTPYGHVVIAVAPVARQKFRQAMDAFGEECEVAVGATAYYVPYVVAPLVGLFDQKVGGEAEVEMSAGRKFQVVMTVTAQRQIERGCPAHLVCRHAYTSGRILTIDVTVSAPFACLVAAMPRIPYRHNRQN